jgi:hypothetical protein
MSSFFSSNKELENENQFTTASDMTPDDEKCFNPLFKRGRGRPPVFVGNKKNQVLAAVRMHGLTYGIKALAEAGISISAPTLGKLAAAEGIKLNRGRPINRRWGRLLEHFAT